MRRVGVVFMCCLLVLCGCSNVNSPLASQEIISILSEMRDNDKTIDIMADPASAYTIKITDELLALLNIDGWQRSPLDEAKSNIDSMLYFDIPHSEDEFRFSRVAVLSNGYALVQIYSSEGFAEKEWYDCGFDKPSAYEKLAEFVFKEGVYN